MGRCGTGKGFRFQEPVCFQVQEATWGLILLAKTGIERRGHDEGFEALADEDGATYLIEYGDADRIDARIKGAVGVDDFHRVHSHAVAGAFRKYDRWSRKIEEVLGVGADNDSGLVEGAVDLEGGPDVQGTVRNDLLCGVAVLIQYFNAHESDLFGRDNATLEVFPMLSEHFFHVLLVEKITSLVRVSVIDESATRQHYGTRAHLGDLSDVMGNQQYRFPLKGRLPRGGGCHRDSSRWVHLSSAKVVRGPPA